MDNVSTCKPTTLTVNNSNQTVATLNGNETKREDVHGFWVEDQKCTFIPLRIDSVLPKLRAIGFKNTDLENLSKFDLAPFAELVTLVLIGNRIKFLDADLFEYNTNIKSLTLKEPNLLIVNGAILIPLTGLTMIEFQMEKIKSECNGLCEDKRCMEEKIYEFNQNCEFDSIYPGFKETANEMKEIALQCKEKLSNEI